MSEPSDAVIKKALSYLADGRVRVLEASVDGTAVLRVVGSSAYTVRWNQGWSCDCPARKPPCAHVYAASLVVLREPVAPVIPHDDDELEALLGGRQEPPAEDDFDLDSLLH